MRKPIYLRTIRIKKNLTQAAVARRAGIEQHTISKLESVTNARPPYATHVAIARALDVDPDRLHFGPDPNYHGPRNDLRRVRLERARRRLAQLDAQDTPAPETDDAEDTTPANPSSGGTV